MVLAATQICLYVFCTLFKMVARRKGAFWQCPEVDRLLAILLDMGFGGVKRFHDNSLCLISL